MSRLRTPAVVAVALALALAAAGCAPAPGTVAEPSPAGTPPLGYVKTIHPEEVDLWRGVNYQGLLLDVRSPDEYADTPGLLENATRIPLGELDARMSEIQGARGKPTLVFDRSGPRGQAAAQILAREGFVDVGFLDGGILAYRQALIEPR